MQKKLFLPLLLQLLSALDWRKPCVLRSLENRQKLKTCNKDCLRPNSSWQLLPQVRRFPWWICLAPGACSLCHVLKCVRSTHTHPFPFCSSNRTLGQWPPCKEAALCQGPPQQNHTLALWRTGESKEVKVKTFFVKGKGDNYIFSLSFNWFERGTN